MDLTDDSLMHIFNLLDLENQISVAQVCRRFHALTSYLWRRQYRKFSIYDDFSGSCTELAILMESINSTVHSMDLGCVSDDEWDVIKLYSYPNVKELTFLQPQWGNDDHVLEMTKVFPNVRTFYPQSPGITGKHIENWRHLECLSFATCERIKFQCFEKILEECHLKQVTLGVFGGKQKWLSTLAFQKFCHLERIHLSCSELLLVPNLTDLSNLKNLVLLSLNNDDLVLKVCKYVNEHRQDDLTELHVSRHFPLKAIFVKTFNNLRELILHWQDNVDIVDISKYAPNLRKIVIVKCKLIKKQDILHLLNSVKMKFIDIQKCECDFQHLSLNAKDIVGRRTSLLHFNFYENKCDLSKTVTVNVQGENNLLKITDKELDSDRFYLDRFGFY